MESLKNSTKLVKRKALKDLSMIFFIGSAIFYYLMKSSGKGHFDELTTNDLITLYFSFSLVAGWRTLNNFSPNGSLIGFVFFVWIKLTISSIIGMFVLPFRIFKNVRKYILLS